MSVFGKSFNFNNQSSTDYSIILVSFEAPGATRENGLNKTILKGEITPYRPVPNYYTDKYSDVLKFSISVVKADREPFTQDEYRKLVSWMTNVSGYAPFFIEDNDSDYHTDIDYFVRCVGCTDFVATGDVSGMTIQMECNAPYGFSKEQHTAFTADSDHNAVITINNTSDDLNDDYYPIIEVMGTASGKLQFINANYDDEIFTLQIKNGQKLIIDNQMGTIEDSLDLFDFETDTNLNWLHLKPGNNQITIIGNASGTIKCRYCRKVGI